MGAAQYISCIITNKPHSPSVKTADPPFPMTYAITVSEASTGKGYRGEREKEASSYIHIASI